MIGSVSTLHLTLLQKLKAKRLQEEVNDLQPEEMGSDKKHSEIDPMFCMRKVLATCIP